ncbi:putative TEGT family carrier/transport protein [Nonlabens ulvanivorans]|nr:Bax inhibitor-1 family protein [Nonlabens ulvanivorans]GAK93259.1 putative TEGT family carrier/transport protein [Nonlabens ulvanivorans]
MDHNNISSYQPLIAASDDTRVAFYKRTYAHVALAVLLFIVVESIFLRIEPLVEFALSMTQGWRWLLMLGGFMLATNYAENIAHKSHDKTKQYLALLLYVVAEAFIFLPMIWIAIAYSGGSMNIFDNSIINQAAVMTLALFTGLSAIVLFTKKDFSFLRNILMVGFFIAIGLIIAGMIFGFNLGLAFSAGMVVLAAGSILYQTSNLVHKYSTDQHVGASLGLFASLMLLFWYLLSIFSRD